MSRNVLIGAAGVIIGLILLTVLPWWLPVIIIAAAIAVAVAGYRGLTPGQRRRAVQQIRKRRQLGR
jgi:membrane protein implicated in regulation of membrane protease activity